MVVQVLADNIAGDDSGTFWFSFKNPLGLLFLNYKSDSLSFHSIRTEAHVGRKLIRFFQIRSGFKHGRNRFNFLLVQKPLSFPAALVEMQHSNPHACLAGPRSRRDRSKWLCTLEKRCHANFTSIAFSYRIRCNEARSTRTAEV